MKTQLVSVTILTKSMSHRLMLILSLYTLLKVDAYNKLGETARKNYNFTGLSRAYLEFANNLIYICD